MSGTNKLYKELDENERQEQIQLLLQLWRDFVAINDAELNDTDVFINHFNLIETIERVSKRKFYYKVFHGIEHLSEFKETALLCFWICKLKPFVVLKPSSPLCVSPNELFCVHIVYCMLSACKDQAEGFHYPDDVTIKNFIYALRYQDMSKEALIQYLESLAISCGILLRQV